MDKNETPTYRFFELRQERNQHRVAYLQVDNVIKSKDIIDYIEKIDGTYELDEYFLDWEGIMEDAGECEISESNRDTVGLHPYRVTTAVTLNQQTNEWMRSCLSIHSLIQPKSK